MINPQDDYFEWLNRFPWEAMVTTRIPPTTPINKAHDALVTEVLRPLAKLLKTQVAAITVIVPGTSTTKPHMHTLALTKHRNLLPAVADGITNFGLVKQLRQPGAKLLTHADALDIRDIYSSGGAEYVACNISDRAEIKYYGLALLKNQLEGFKHESDQMHQ